MRRKRWGQLGAPVISALACAVLFVGCKKDDRPPPLGSFSDPVPNPDVPSERLPTTTEDFVETGCEAKAQGHVTQCGIITVAEGEGSSNMIELSVVRVFSNADDVQEEPVIYLEGGPGAAAVGSVEILHEYFAPIAPDRDFIYFDQRGTGLSEPSLQCFEGGPVDEALTNCFDRLSEDSDLNEYNTINNAADVDAIRRAFGYEKVNLYGISYGTRLGLTVMRDHPEGVRAALLDGMVPLEGDLLGEVGLNGYSAFEELVAACEADEYCNETYPDPLGQLIGIVEELNDEPAILSSGDELFGDFVLTVIFNLLYSPYTLSLIPMMVDDIDGGDYSLFEELEAVAGGGGISFGMHLSLHCQEEIPFSSREAYEAFDAQVPEAMRAGLSGELYLDWCEYWPVDQAPASENEPVVSDIPTLLTAGQFDPITPAKYSEWVHESLTNSQYFLIEGESHGASTSDCGVQLGHSFFQDPESDVEAGCLADLPELEFANGSGSLGSGRVGGKLKIHTERPSPEEIEEALEDLRRRLHR